MAEEKLLASNLKNVRYIKASITENKQFEIILFKSNLWWFIFPLLISNNDGINKIIISKNKAIRIKIKGECFSFLFDTSSMKSHIKSPTKKEIITGM